MVLLLTFWHPTHYTGDDDKSFEELGLDIRLIRALTKKGIEKPTPIQQVAIPLILEGKDVVARAKTGSGKTFAYLLLLLQKPSTDATCKNKLAPAVFILVPTRELSQQVYSEVVSLVELGRVQLKVLRLTSSRPASDLILLMTRSTYTAIHAIMLVQRTAMAGPPDILVSTSGCVTKCLSLGVVVPDSISRSLEVLVLDEADLLLSYGYEDDLKALTVFVPRRCQCLLMSATSRYLVLHNLFILTLPEVGEVKDDVIPKNVQQYWISCSARDKLLYALALLKLELVHKKVLAFTNTIDLGFRLKLFLEKEA
ncbi:DEAD-box ATP-dependent RNA helicase 16-like [Tripterygium wilfordii]|uniref:RNA helicase n=1 Tax=Tripterygium wilfordii TaxID=458696 RepID=A0A7J7DLU3_TRIWF|nr:DEAD-box ATP-dependent RNA helicase 16-like [Tripterygium wilfordii]